MYDLKTVCNETSKSINSHDYNKTFTNQISALNNP